MEGSHLGDFVKMETCRMCATGLGTFWRWGLRSEGGGVLVKDGREGGLGEVLPTLLGHQALP